MPVLKIMFPGDFIKVEFSLYDHTQGLSYPMKDCLFSIVSSDLHTQPGHPESAARFSNLLQWVDHPPYVGMHHITPQPARNDDLLRVHTPDMLLALRIACGMGLHQIEFAPTYVGESSYEAALMAAGATLELNRQVLLPASPARRAFAIVRPPGHHVDREHPAGFCLLNNLAVAVADALESGLQKVAIIDFDAHHGNGTQNIFLDDPRVGFFSMHQEGIYPGSGGLDEICLVQKRIINLPLPPNCGDEVFDLVSQSILKPWLLHLRPDMIFVSAGFDGHFNDPLTALNYSTAGFYDFSRQIIDFAEQFSSGRVLFVLEGGYDARDLAENSQAVLCALVGGDQYPNSNGQSQHKPVNITDRIRLLVKLHELA